MLRFNCSDIFSNIHPMKNFPAELLSMLLPSKLFGVSLFKILWNPFHKEMHFRQFLFFGKIITSQKNFFPFLPRKIKWKFLRCFLVIYATYEPTPLSFAPRLHQALQAKERAEKHTGFASKQNVQGCFLAKVCPFDLPGTGLECFINGIYGFLYFHF